MMEVHLTPRPLGCLTVFLGLISFWIIPTLIRGQERHYAKHLDDKGVTTLGGKRILWRDLTRLERRRYKMRGLAGTVIEAYRFRSPKGEVGFLSSRMTNFDEVMAYVWPKVPHIVKAV